MYYGIIKDNKISGCTQCEVNGAGIFSVPLTAEQYNNIEKYMWDGEKIVLNVNYEKEKEQERVGNLQVTKRVFALGLQQLGITYSQLKELIATNEQAQLEWDLCVELQRKNPLLDIMAAQLEVSSEMLDYIFRRANGENVNPPETEETKE